MPGANMGDPVRRWVGAERAASDSFETSCSRTLSRASLATAADSWSLSMSLALSSPPSIPRLLWSACSRDPRTPQQRHHCRRRLGDRDRGGRLPPHPPSQQPRVRRRAKPATTRPSRWAPSNCPLHGDGQYATEDVLALNDVLAAVTPPSGSLPQHGRRPNPAVARLGNRTLTIMANVRFGTSVSERTRVPVVSARRPCGRWSTIASGRLHLRP